MSKLSQQWDKAKDAFSDVGSQPLRKLANVVTLGQTDKLRDLYNSTGTAKMYNNNKSAILQGAAMAALGAATGGLGAGALGTGSVAAGMGLGAITGGASGALSGMDKDKARENMQKQVNAKDAAGADLNTILNGITGNDPSTNPTTGTPYFNQPSAPSTGGNPKPNFNPSQPATQEQLPHGALPFDTLSPDIQQTLAAQSPALASRLQQIIGPGTGSAQTSAGQLLDANDLTTQLSQQTLDKQAEMRKQQISDLSELLSKKADTQYNRDLPGLYEDLNTRGLLRSSDLGNKLALKKQESMEDISNQLAQQQLGYNDQYINGMGNITNQYNSGIGSALEREFSLKDYADQVNASKALGQAVTPVQPYNGKTATGTATNAIGLASAANSMAGSYKAKTA